MTNPTEGAAAISKIKQSSKFQKKNESENLANRDQHLMKMITASSTQDNFTFYNATTKI